MHSIRWFSRSLASFLALASVATAATSASTTVDLGYAVIQGSTNPTTGMNEFLGFKYATAERFQLPKTPATNRNTYNASFIAPICWNFLDGGSPTIYTANTTGVEDCLYMNVWAPADVSASEWGHLPVLVWIHGGGYQRGSMMGYNGTAMIKGSGYKFVEVAFQYRLGAFGFLAGSAVKQHGILNAGLYDQQFALQWTQQHVSKFGGDPGHVTIWGESAGAGSVLQQVIANGGDSQSALGLSQPLFEAAIASSVFVPYQYHGTDPAVENIFKNTAWASGCNNATAAAMFNCLQKVPEATLAHAGQHLAFNAFYGTWIYVPVVDGKFIVADPHVILSGSEFNAKKLLVVSNLDEGYAYTDPRLMGTINNNTAMLNTDFDNYVATLYPRLTAEQRAAAEALYPMSVYNSINNTFYRAERVMGESVFTCPGYWLSDAFGSNGWRALYAVPPSHHGADVAVYWPSAATPVSASLFNAFAGGFVSMILNYTVNANPLNATAYPNWPTFDTGNEMVFNTTDGTYLGQSDPYVASVNVTYVANAGLVERCNFWKSVAASLPE